jgi:hypothetical protein
MSIYQPTKRHTIDVQTNNWSESSQRRTANMSKDFEPLRIARPPQVLLPRTNAWLAALPEAVRPTHLPTQFARTANLLASCWSDPQQRANELDNLLMDKRGGRRGFPIEVHRELVTLRDWVLSSIGRK